jgi:hypothetical protein
LETFLSVLSVFTLTENGNTCCIIMQRKIPYCKLSCDISANNVGGLYGYHSPSYSPPYLMNIDVSSSIGKMTEA